MIVIPPVILSPQQTFIFPLCFLGWLCLQRSCVSERTRELLSSLYCSCVDSPLQNKNQMGLLIQANQIKVDLHYGLNQRVSAISTGRLARRFETNRPSMPSPHACSAQLPSQRRTRVRSNFSQQHTRLWGNCVLCRTGLQRAACSCKIHHSGWGECIGWQYQPMLGLNRRTVLRPFRARASPHPPHLLLHRQARCRL